MEALRKTRTDTGLRYSYELLVEPEVRKVLTLEQIFTVFRQSVQPESVTEQDAEGVAEDTLGMFQSGGGERYYRTRTGQFTREGRVIRYGLDDDVVNNEDGSLTAAFFWWETEGEEDPAVEAWFRELARAIEDAQENLVLFGRI
jgi:hypothetical protein